MGNPHIVRSPALLPITEASRDELVDFGTKNLRGENIRPFHQGEASTRFGFQALGNAHLDATTPTAGYKLLTSDMTTARICDGFIEVYDAASACWIVRGRVPECSLATIELPSLGTASTIEDQEYCNGYIAVGYRVVGSVNATYAFYALVNATSWAVVRAPEQLATAVTIGPVLLGSYGTIITAVVADLTGSTIKAWYLDTASAATINAGWVSIGTLASDFQAGNAVAVTSLSNRVALVYRNTSAGTSKATLLTFTSAGIAATTTINTSSVLPGTVDVAGSIADTLWVAWNETTAVNLIGVNGTTLATTATKVLMATCGTTPVTLGIAPSSAAGKGRLVINDTTSGNIVIARSFKTTAGAAAGDGAGVSIQNAVPCGRPLQYAGRYYVPTYGGAGGNDQKVCILVDLTDDVTSLRPIANVAPGLAVTSAYSKGKITAVASKLYFGLEITRSGAANASALAEFDFASATRWHSATFGGSVYLSGGVLSCWDGTRVAEACFLMRPTLPTTSTGGTGITCVTGWRYVCIYEEVDSDGNWHVSGISTPSASTTAVTNKTVTVSTAPLTISSRINTTSNQAASVRVAVYRTLDGGVAPYYRIGTSVNDTTSATVTFADAVPDATAAANAKLYEQPGVNATSQDRRAPPGLSCIVAYNGMLVGASGSDVWASGQNVSGEGVWFSPVFQEPVAGDGDINAMWVMDGTLFAAKRRDIYAIAGEAPSDNGASGGLGLPRKLAVDVGAVSSITCVTSLGAFYLSDRGIELFTRAQTTQRIGQPVQDQLSAFPYVSAMTLDPSSSGTVLVDLSSDLVLGLAAGTGRTLVFDMSSANWICVDRRRSLAGVADAPSQSARMVYTANGHRYAWMDATGVVHVETRTSHLDADHTFVTPLIETGWFNGFQNEQRVYRVSLLFQRYTAAGLKVEVAYDYGDYVALDNAVWTFAQTSGQRQLEIAIKPRGESMKFRITATTPADLSDGGQGIGLFGIQLDLAEKQGPIKGTVRLDPALRR